VDFRNGAATLARVCLTRRQRCLYKISLICGDEMTGLGAWLTQVHYVGGLPDRAGCGVRLLVEYFRSARVSVSSVYQFGSEDVTAHHDRGARHRGNCGVRPINCYTFI
jgi:hypothetical protein